MKKLISLVEAIKGARVVRDVPLAKHTTWRVGGPAACMVWLDDEHALAETLAALGEVGVEFFVLGNGSNVLVSDDGFAGAVLRLSGELASISFDGSAMLCGGGAALGSVLGEAAKRGMAGLEFAVGIPGTVGGAVMANAGALGESVADVLASVQAAAEHGEGTLYETFAAAYREPLVPKTEIVVKARFDLTRASEAEVRRRMESNASARTARQPRGATAGSVFKNTQGESAGMLIEKCGLKGRARGGARISEVHANFIVNEGGARASDIRDLMELAGRAVYERFGRQLEPEVVLIGFEQE